jgi:acyl-CoA thioester hydrolase
MILFETTLKARTYECDIYGHVNNATFLNYCEYARVEFLNALGYDLKMLMRKGFLLPIVKIEIEFKKPVYAGENLRISISWISRGRSSSVFEQRIIKSDSDTLAARANVTWVVTDLQGKPVSIPQELIDKALEIYHELPPARSESSQK